MWNHCRKFALICVGSSKNSCEFRSVPNAISSYVTKAYYGDYIYSKEKQNSELPIVKLISEDFIKPKFVVKDSDKPYHLGPMDLPMLSCHHIQFGFLFNKPSKINERKFSMYEFLRSLKESFSRTLVHFYPLAGRLVLDVDVGKKESRVYVDCNKGPGARFIHATLDLTILNILSTNDDNPLVVQSLFDLGEEVVNYDGHTKPLLCVQVTELIDGIFIACSINHAIIDGVLYWLFWSTWSEIHKGNESRICESCLPVYHQWVPEGHNFPIPIPFTHRDEIVRKFKAPPLKEKIFQFSADTIGRLKSKANEESNANNISSFQVLCALIWRAIIRANRLPHDQVVYNHLAANIRGRFNPPFPKNCFGNIVQVIIATTTAGEILENNLGWTASLLHQSVANLNDKIVREYVDKWLRSPFFYYHEDFLGFDSVTIANSPKFDMYGHDFGLGKAITFRTGYSNKGIGFVYACPGFNGGGSVDFVIHLPVESMNALELDEEFTSFFSLP